MVSIEMIEAVGHEYFDTYFAKASSLLKPHGMFLMQAITIADQRYEQARRSIDFIQRYIFPGGSLPSVARIAESVARMTDMRIFHLEDIGPHYARTLRAWRDRFSARLAGIRSMGYPKEFLRMWEYYFCYCEAGFEERVIGAAQFFFTKPLCRRDALVTLPHSGTAWHKLSLARESGGR
jgi:cyclopropane-fatty-acyl-phospholipid synthase